MKFVMVVFTARYFSKYTMFILEAYNMKQGGIFWTVRQYESDSHQVFLSLSLFDSLPLSIMSSQCSSMSVTQHGVKASMAYSIDEHYD